MTHIYFCEKPKALLIAGDLRSIFVSEVISTKRARLIAAELERQHAEIERLRAFCSYAMRGQDWIDVDQFFDAIKASPAAGVPKWRPIETAPKDGSHFIATNGISVAEGWWEHQEPFFREKRDIDGVYIDQEESDGFDGWLDCGGGMLPEPTHWMPLPAAPQPGEQQEV